MYCEWCKCMAWQSCIAYYSLADGVAGRAQSEWHCAGEQRFPLGSAANQTLISLFSTHWVCCVSPPHSGSVFSLWFFPIFSMFAPNPGLILLQYSLSPVWSHLVWALYKQGSAGLLWGESVMLLHLELSLLSHPSACGWPDPLFGPSVTAIKAWLG